MAANDLGWITLDQKQSNCSRGRLQRIALRSPTPILQSGKADKLNIIQSGPSPSLRNNHIIDCLEKV